MLFKMTITRTQQEERGGGGVRHTRKRRSIRCRRLTSREEQEQSDRDTGSRHKAEEKSHQGRLGHTRTIPEEIKMTGCTRAHNKVAFNKRAVVDVENTETVSQN